MNTPALKIKSLFHLNEAKNSTYQNKNKEKIVNQQIS